MRHTAKLIMAGALLAGSAFPVHAQVLGGIIGGDGDDALVTLNDGPASESGLVNVGVGGGGGNVLDVGIGGSEPLATVEVGTGNGINADIGVGGDIANGNVNIGGNGGLLDADVDLLDGGVNATVGVGGNGTNASSGQGGGIGNNVANRANGLPANANPNAVANTGKGAGAACVGQSTNELARLVQSTQVNASWAQASDISIQRVSVCPDVKAWLSAQLVESGLGAALQNAVVSDALISASLSRSSYGPDRVFAVEHSGRQLTVFVY